MKNDRRQILIAGVGGQGVLFATKVVLETARRIGSPVIGSETHGMSQRGGSVVSVVKIGGFSNPLSSPGGADLLLALQRDESYRNLSFVRRGGACVANSPDPGFLDAGVRAALEGLGVSLFPLDADKAAAEVGSPVSSNLVCLGFAVARKLLPFEPAGWKACISAISSGKLAPSSIAAFEKGMELGEK